MAKIPSLSPQARKALNDPALSRTRQRRKLLDKFADWGIGLGGVSIILAVCLIFFYLLYEVLPLFKSAEMSLQHKWTYHDDQANELLDQYLDEQKALSLNVYKTGQLKFISTLNGKLIKEFSLPLTPSQTITSFKSSSSDFQLMGFGLSDGQVLYAKHIYDIGYEDGDKTVIPSIAFPFGDEPFEVSEEGLAVTKIALSQDDDSFTLVYLLEDSSVGVKKFELEENFYDDSLMLEEDSNEIITTVEGEVTDLLVDQDQRWIYLFKSSGLLTSYDLTKDDIAESLTETKLLESGTLSTVEFLLGGISLLVGDSNGKIAQWFPVRDENNNYKLHKIREFEVSDQPIQHIFPEQRRKGFVAVTHENGGSKIGFYNSTAQTNVLNVDLEFVPTRLSLSPRADGLYIIGADTAFLYDIENKHPEVSFSVLWQKIWYENYAEPEYVWQSSAATNDFEPKFSLMPLAFGTLKASFYAMLLAMPLAICGAIFTAYFMAPALRTKVKPAIELMEALPTVILGFLAGLWLAPLVESKMPGIFTILLVLPFIIVGVGFIWSLLPNTISRTVPDGWEPVVLIPVIVIFGYFSMSLSDPLEAYFFNGDMRLWLTNEMGIPYDQRNALIVGIAMGFAVIPTIFSITEDAIFSVPKSLTFGSLALGASPWQTLVRVVLPTASPGIFSAVMIGFGRAVGETMIILMATGNTPIMEMNIFEGFRTLSANIAVEMPEAEVDSSHFRILFLAGLVLFVFTFFFNTTAEVVRQRLREKYGSL